MASNDREWRSRQTRAAYAALPKGPGFTAEAVALFAAMSVQPSDARKTVINACIAALKNAGVWTLSDLIYVLAAHDSQAARLNWKNPGSNTLSLVNAPTFTTDRGFTGNGTNTQLLPGVAYSALSNYVQNSAHMSCWTLTNVDANRADIGQTAGSNIFLIPRTTDILRVRMNGDSNLEAAATTSVGFVTANRSSSSAVQLYKNGSSVASSGANTSSALSGNIELLSATQVSGFSTNQDAAFTFGGSLDGTQAGNLYTALLAYMQAVGAA